MGIFDLFTAGKQAKELTRALIAAYAVPKMNNDQRQAIMFRVYIMLCETYGYDGCRLTFDEAIEKFNSSPGIVQAGLMVNAIIEMRIHHSVRDLGSTDAECNGFEKIISVTGFQWDYIPNPFALAVYSKKALRTAISNIRKYGIDPEECFAGPREI